MPAKHLITPQDGPEFLLRCGGAIGRVHDVLLDSLDAHLKRKVSFDMKLVRSKFWEAKQEEVMDRESADGAVRMKAATTTGLPKQSSSEKVRAAQGTTGRLNGPPRKVGEARPSHFKDESSKWE